MLKLHQLRKKIIFIGFLFLFFAGPVLAEILPPDTISIITNTSSTASTTLLVSNTTTTIISFFVNHPFNALRDTLYCGNEVVLRLDQSVGDVPGFPVLWFIKTCNKNIYYKSGSTNDDTIVLNYLPYDYTKTSSASSGGISTSTLTLISNPSTGASFYIDSSINYGDILVILFLLLFAIFGIVKVITDFWIPHRVIRKS